MPRTVKPIGAGIAGLLLGIVGLFLTLLLASQSVEAVANDKALVISIDGPIGPATEEFVARGLDEAVDIQAGIIILRIDTPGGLSSSTRGIIKSVMASDIPVVGFVAPSGARAASAGAYILLASHIAVMAPGTNVGSATPVMIGGMPGAPPPEADNPSDHPDMEDKVLNDAMAFMRAIAEIRGRPAEIAEKFVSEAANLTANEAVSEKLVDWLARDQTELLEKLNGLEIIVVGEKMRLNTSELAIIEFEATWQEEFLQLISNPNIAYLLLLAGIYGLFIEGSNPGLIIPGVAGAISLILGLYALQMLPVNYAGLALIILGILLMGAEAFSPSFGLLGVGGIVSFFAGSIMLFDSDIPGLKLSPSLIVVATLTSAAIVLVVGSLAVRAWRKPPVTGNDALIGQQGKVLSWNGAAGRIFAHGEVWNAESDSQLAVGKKVIISSVNGLILTVEEPQGKQDKEKQDGV